MNKTTQAQNLLNHIDGELAPIRALVAMIESGPMPQKNLLSMAEVTQKALNAIDADIAALNKFVEKREAVAKEWVETHYPKSHFNDRMADLFQEGMNHKEPYIGRVYNLPVPSYGHLIPLGEWRESVDDGFFTDDDGSGYFAKDGMYSRCSDDIFFGDPEDATHVIWFNK